MAHHLALAGGHVGECLTEEIVLVGECLTKELLIALQFVEDRLAKGVHIDSICGCSRS